MMKGILGSYRLPIPFIPFISQKNAAGLFAAGWIVL